MAYRKYAGEVDSRYSKSGHRFSSPIVEIMGRALDDYGIMYRTRECICGYYPHILLTDYKVLIDIGVADDVARARTLQEAGYILLNYSKDAVRRSPVGVMHSLINKLLMLNASCPLPVVTPKPNTKVIKSVVDAKRAKLSASIARLRSEAQRNLGSNNL